VGQYVATTSSSLLKDLSCFLAVKLNQSAYLCASGHHSHSPCSSTWVVLELELLVLVLILVLVTWVLVLVLAVLVIVLVFWVLDTNLIKGYGTDACLGHILGSSGVSNIGPLSYIHHSIRQIQKFAKITKKEINHIIKLVQFFIFITQKGTSLCDSVSFEPLSLNSIQIYL